MNKLKTFVKIYLENLTDNHILRYGSEEPPDFDKMPTTPEKFLIASMESVMWLLKHLITYGFMDE
jgi:hypothetical protein